MTRPLRYGMTLPFSAPLPDHPRIAGELAAVGYTDIWSCEVDGLDGFTPLALAATGAPDVHLGTAIVSPFTRGPAVLAMTAAALAELAPGRFHLGIGSASRPIVQNWNAAAFEQPYERVRDTVRFLRAALAGERVAERYETFAVDGFRLARPPQTPPPIYLAALREGMLRLAGREADGVILNWLSADDVKKVVPYVHEGGPGKEIVGRIFVCPTDDADAARAVCRRMVTSYLNVPGYANYQRWLGRTELLQPMWDAWAAGDRRRALAAVPDEVVDDLIVHGTPAQCRAAIQRYVDNGVTVPVIMFVDPGLGTDPLEDALALAPDPA
ncbi:LLM class F420-dependent oxidoreductase [Yinghuangia seranimata]|uniref:LLM class F420-dependent oxidoreductase n=1 Tax=Yinghuangia seranimata TaxID=408067 RepID=UPI00248CB6C3|nr:LLM class F420-dependent oxidoreductase [Yinghuangia seranimata]MDI2132409.1 LLM class F420-dependent oxidoreductase [Yinghuangia seranimata]